MSDTLVCSLIDRRTDKQAKITKKIMYIFVFCSLAEARQLDEIFIELRVIDQGILTKKTYLYLKKPLKIIHVSLIPFLKNGLTDGQTYRVIE